MKLFTSRLNKIFGDMVLNLIATAVPTFVLQLIILPLIGSRMNSESYGLLVTILALLNVVPSTFGNTLNNIRLIYDNEYKSRNIEGDFNAILIIFGLMNVIVVGGMSYYYDEKITPISITLIILVALAWMAKEYYAVAFRLVINYKAILINNLYHVIGYGIGYGLYIVTDQWQLIYLCGYVFGLLYIFRHSVLWKEKLAITKLFKEVTIQGILLLIAGILTRVTVYADKMLIYPLLGGTVTSLYYVATVFGKVVALVVTPVTSVVLTYLAKNKKRNNSLFKKTLCTGSLVCCIGYLCCIVLSRPVLGILYPQYIDEAMKYIYITSATTVLYALITVVNPFILNYFTMWWQIAINGLSAIMYVAFSVGLLSLFGLMGFCIGALISNIVKLLFSIAIYYKAMPKSA